MQAVPRQPSIPSRGRTRAKLGKVAQLEKPVGSERPRAPEPRPRTIGRLWFDALAADRPYPAYLVETDDGWREVSWREAGRRVEELANGLLTRGVRRGDAVA